MISNQTFYGKKIVNSTLHQCPPQVYILSQLNPCCAGEEWERSVGINRVGNEKILHRVK